MLKLYIGNKAYSSWSLRGWLACKQSGLPFEEIVAPLYDDNWEIKRKSAEYAPSAGKVPILWDGEIAIWDSLAILDHLAEHVGPELFWPADAAARGFARSITAEMHSGFTALRRDHSMNVRRRYPATTIGAEVSADLDRIAALWEAARSRWGQSGPYLFGTFSAADIFYAPVVTRIMTYALPVPASATAYCDVIMAHPWMVEWTEAAMKEPWVLERYEQPMP